MRWVLLFLFLFPASVMASGRSEIGLGATGAAINFSSAEDNFGIQAEYHYLISKGFQFGTQSAFLVRDTGGTTHTGVVVMVGPTINFPFDTSLIKSFFWTTLVGFSHDSATASGLKFTFLTKLGKRFAISNQIAYSPHAVLTKVAGQKVALTINLVSFRLVF